MKNLASLILAVLFSIGAMAQGINFTDDNWAGLLAKAKAENKIIFVDAYTTWCGPCKVMARDIFPQEEVGEFFNANFINAKIDMEKGEGIEIRKKYEVNAFPTYIFVNGDGELVHRGLGSMPAENFIELGKAASNPETQLITLMKRYKGGEKDPEFLMNYAKALRSTNDASYADVADEYLKTQKDWTTPDNVKFIYDFTSSVESKNYKFLIENKEVVAKVVGKDKLDDRIGQIIMYNTMSSAKPNLEKADELFKEAFPTKAAEMSSELRVSYYMYARTDDAADKFTAAAIKHMKEYDTDDWQMLNSVAWRFYELTDDKKSLKMAKKWAKKSISIDNNHFNNDTLAAIYYKMGKKKPALKYAELAVEQAKTNNADYSSTTDLINKINAM